MHMCACVHCVFVATPHRCTQTKALFVSTLVQDAEEELLEETHKEPFDIATLSAHKFSCCVVVCCLSSSTVLFSCCVDCFHVVLLCVFLCTIKA